MLSLRNGSPYRLLSFVFIGLYSNLAILGNIALTVTKQQE
jgi:hypothetical protein